MPRSATTAYRKTGRPSPKKAKPTAPKKPKRTAAEKGKRTAAKRTTQRSPKRVTPTSKTKTKQSSVAAMRVRIEALEGQLREAQGRENATAEVLGVINSSPGNLAPVFDAMLEKATTLCEAAFGIMMTWDGQSLHRVAFRGASEELIAALRQPNRALPGTMAERVLNGANVITVADVRDDPSYQVPGAPARAVADIGGARSYVAIALRKDGALLGTIAAYRQEVRPFTDKQIALLQNFAAQAVIAMENARLITETREALEQQTATAEVLGVINSSPGDLSPVFDAMLGKALTLCDASFGQLVTFDGVVFRAAAWRGYKPETGLGTTPIPGMALYQLVQGEQVVQVTDITADDVYRSGNAVRRRLADEYGARTAIWVALRKESALLGAFVIYRTEVRPFSDKEIALLQNFAAQAVIAMENARLITETREALEQQTATAEVLGVINSSPGDLTPVFDAILEKAMHLCGAAFGELRARDGDSFRSAATRGVPPAFAEYRRENAFVAEPGSLGARILSGEDVVHVLDLKDEDVYRAGYRNRRALVDLGGARTALVVSLRKDDTVLGFIIVYRQEVRPFSNQQIAVLQNFADQAVIAMENARLLGELRQRTEEVAELNRGLEARVAEQVEELGRVGRLKRFLAPQLAELIVSQGDEKILESHRREIVVVFCDLRGYTAFTETAEPEEVLDFLRQYHGALGPLVAQYEGTLDQFSGDGIMVFFNDPVPIPDPAERAVKMAAAMREAAGNLIAAWRRRGRELGFGAGIAQGYATLGQIGFAERSGYTAIGTVCNLAARLCAEAKDGQILVAQRVAVAVEQAVGLEELGSLALKGLTQPVVAYNVPLVAGQAAFRVIEGGAPIA
jgi:class 3 adenylate cyclase